MKVAINALFRDPEEKSHANDVVNGEYEEEQVGARFQPGVKE